MPRQLIIEADGGSRGNPGIAAGGAVVIDGETQQVLSSVGVYVGIATSLHLLLFFCHQLTNLDLSK